MKKATPKGKSMSIATVQGHYTHKFAYTISHQNHYIPRHINDEYINSYFALKWECTKSSKQKYCNIFLNSKAPLLFWQVHRKKKVRKFPVPSRDVTNKLSLGGNNDVITELFLPRGSLVCDIPAGDGKLVNLFLRCTLHGTLTSDLYVFAFTKYRSSTF